MPFTPLPPRLKVPLRTRHTELVAVLGEADPHSRPHVAIGDGLLIARYAGRMRYLHQRWAWGAGAAKRVALPGVLVAAREDGTVVACRDPDVGDDEGDFQFDVWREGKKRRTFALPKFGSMDAPERSACFVHGALVYERQPIDDEKIAAMREGKDSTRSLLRLIDVDTGASVALDDGSSRGPTPRVMTAADGQLAVLRGKELTFHALPSGRKRSAVTLRVPEKHAIRELVLSPDGTSAVVGLAHCPSPEAPVTWRGYHVVALRTGKLTQALSGEAGNLTFADAGRVLVAGSASGFIALWDTRSWKLLERFKLQPGRDNPPRLLSWDAQQAIVIETGVGLTYVLKVSAEPAPLETPRPPKSAKASPLARKTVARPKRPWPAQAVAFKLAPKGEDLFGGLPSIAEGRWPRCAGCEEPMTFVLSLGASARRLPLRKHDALLLFTCGAGTCDTFEPFGGRNAALLVSGDKPSREVPQGLLGKPVRLKPRRLLYSAAKKTTRDGALPNKLGGAPDWLQGNETPACAQCKRKMRFVLQLDESADAKLNFAGGRGYLFVCEDEHDARFLWQS